jgi:hypothetical protein
MAVNPVPDDAELDPRWTTSTRMPAVRPRKSTEGPYDAADSEALDLQGALDFGSLRVPMPARAQLQVEKGTGELLRAVHVLVPSGRVSLSALAAPRSSPLWRQLADEIAESLTGDGARVRSEWGEWGREVQAGSNGALSRFIGVDGPRWMLYGVATGPAESSAELAHTLREMIRHTVVDRGTDPLPVKTVLPLRLAEHLEELVEGARERTTLDVAPARLAHDQDQYGQDSHETDGHPSSGYDRDPYRRGQQSQLDRRADRFGQDEYVRAQYVEPQYVEPQYVEPQYVEPQYVEPQYVESGYEDAGYLNEGYPDERYGDERYGGYRPDPGPPAARRPAPSRGRSQPDHGVPRAVPEASPAERSIGLRRSDLHPVPPRGPAGSGQQPEARPAAAHGLPPVPSIDSIDTAGLPRVPLVETTWSMAIPVVSSDEVEQEPAWAELRAAPAFWPSPPRTDPIDPTGPPELPRYASDQFGMSPGEALPSRPALDDLGFGLPPTGLDPLPGEPGGPPLPPAPEPVPWVAPLSGGHHADPTGGHHADPVEWPGVARPDRPAGVHDSLHDALTSDAAVTQERLPRMTRRARHRRPD